MSEKLNAVLTLDHRSAFFSQLRKLSVTLATAHSSFGRHVVVFHLFHEIKYSHICLARFSRLGILVSVCVSTISTISITDGWLSGRGFTVSCPCMCVL